MLKNNYLEIIETVYDLKATAMAAKESLSVLNCIDQIIDTLHFASQESNATVPVNFFGKDILVQYGIIVHKLTNTGYHSMDNKLIKDYDTLGRWLDMAGVLKNGGNDFKWENINKHNNISEFTGPYFKLISTVADVTFPDYSDFPYGDILNKLIDINHKSYTKTDFTWSSKLKEIIEGSGSPLTSEQQEHIASLNTVASIVERVLTALVGNFVSKRHEEIQAERLSTIEKFNKYAYLKASEALLEYNKKEEPFFSKQKTKCFTNGEYSVCMTEPTNGVERGLDDVVGTVDCSKVVSTSIYDRERATGIKDTVIGYLNSIGFDNSRLNSGTHLLIREKYLTVDSMNKIRQFSRLLNLVSKATVEYDIEDVKLGFLTKETGEFEQRDDIREWIVRLLNDRSLEEEDLDYALKLYSDNDAILGIKPNERMIEVHTKRSSKISCADEKIKGDFV